MGVIVASRREARPFSAEELALHASFADQAVIAIENARLLTELRESLDRQTAMSEVLAVISASQGDLSPVFRAIAENATRLCHADFGNAARIENGHFIMVHGTERTPPALNAYYREMEPMQPVGGLTFQTDPVLNIADVAAHNSYRAGNPLRVALVERGGVRSMLRVSMFKDEEYLGVLAVYRTRIAPFNEKEVELVQSFARQAVIAIENARLLTELRKSLDRQTATAEVLGVISSSPGELERCSKRCWRTPCGFAGPRRASLPLVGDVLHRAASRGVAPELQRNPKYGSRRARRTKCSLRARPCMCPTTRASGGQSGGRPAR